MPIYKRCSRCGKRLLAGTTCHCVKRQYQEYDKNRDEKQKAFYSSQQWQRLRQQAISKVNGLDLYSLYQLGRIETGFTVHHIEPVEDNWSRRNDLTNLIYLTQSNHRFIHSKMEQNKEETEQLLFDLLQRFQKEMGG